MLFWKSTYFSAYVFKNCVGRARCMQCNVDCIGEFFTLLYFPIEVISLSLKFAYQDTENYWKNETVFWTIDIPLHESCMAAANCKSWYNFNIDICDLFIYEPEFSVVTQCKLRKWTIFSFRKYWLNMYTIISLMDPVKIIMHVLI